MRTKLVVLFILVLQVSSGRGQDTLSPTDILPQIAGNMQKRAEFQKRWDAATREVERQRRWAGNVARELARPWEAQRCRILKYDLGSAEHSLDRARAELAAAKIQLPEARAAKRAEAQAKIQASKKASEQALAAYNTGKAKLAEEFGEPLDGLVQKLMTGIVRKPAGLGISRLKAGSPVHGSVGEAVWYDTEDEKVATFRLSLGAPQAQQEQEASAVHKLRFMGFGFHSGAQVHIEVGGFRGWLSFQNPDWTSEKECLAIARKLIDLDLLSARMGPENRALVQQVVQRRAEYTKKLSELHSRCFADVGKGEPGIRQAERLQRELSQPYSAERVAQLERAVAVQEKAVKNALELLTLAGIKAPQERKAKSREADAELKKRQTAYDEAATPLLGERKALEDERQTLSRFLRGAVEPALLAPTGYTDSKVSVTSIGGVACTASWRVDGRQAAQGTICFGRPSSLPTDAETVAGKHPILEWDDKTIAVQIGDVAVRLKVSKVKWQSKERVRELVPQLFDLDQLASWSVPAGWTPQDIRQMRVEVVY